MLNYFLCFWLSSVTFQTFLSNRKMTVLVGARYLQPTGDGGKLYLLLQVSRLSLALRQSACHVAPHVCKRTFTAGWDQVSWPNEIIRCYTQDVGNRSKKRWRITYQCKKEPKYVNKCSLAVVGVWVKTYCQREPWFLIIAQLFADILHASITSFTDWHVVWLKKISWLD